MATTRPDLATLIKRVLATLAARLGLSTIFPRSVLAAFGNAIALVGHAIYGRVERMERNILASTTVDPEMLDRHAAELTMARKPAAPARGAISVSGSAGTLIPAGTTWKRADGVTYAADDAVTIVSSPASVAVTATTGGLATNADLGTSLKLVSTVAGISPSTATVLDDGAGGGLTDGLDAETDDELRARILQRKSEIPNGGSHADYVRWALEVPGVTRAWCMPRWMGARTVGVAFVCDDQPVSIIPDAGKITEVFDHIEPLRPVTTELFVIAPSPVDLDLTLSVTPATDEVKAAIEASVRDLLLREATLGGTLLLTHLREAISTADGEFDHVLTSPAADVVCAPGEILVMGSITWS